MQANQFSNRARESNLSVSTHVPRLVTYRRPIEAEEEPEAENRSATGQIRYLDDAVCG